MSNTLEKAREIIDDLKHSWYFRLWALFWLVLFLTGFSGMIKYAQRSDEAKNQDWRLSLYNAAKLDYPQLIFRFPDEDADNTFESVTCTQYPSNLHINRQACAGNA